MITLRSFLRATGYSVAFFSLGAHAASFCEDALKVQRSFLYQISRDGKSSHILGTIHLGVALDDLPASVDRVVRNATDLTVETKKLGPVLDAVENAMILGSMMRFSGPKLSDVLTPRELERLHDKLRSNDMPTGLIDRMTPLAANFMILSVMKNFSEKSARGRARPRARDTVWSKADAGSRGPLLPTFDDEEGHGPRPAAIEARRR